MTDTSRGPELIKQLVEVFREHRRDGRNADQLYARVMLGKVLDFIETPSKEMRMRCFEIDWENAFNVLREELGEPRRTR